MLRKTSQIFIIIVLIPDIPEYFPGIRIGFQPLDEHIRALLSIEIYWFFDTSFVQFDVWVELNVDVVNVIQVAIQFGEDDFILTSILILKKFS